jgi:chemotaxis methyl-accepting protein methylase
MDDSTFHQILAHFHLSPQGYRKVRKGVKKRLSRHMQQLGCAHVHEYLAVLTRNPGAEDACRMHLTVSISRFFRDRGLWYTLADPIIPRMTAGFEGLFRVWSCGCARGEEVYSFKILWERLQPSIELPELALWGTDMNPDYIETAKQGAYTLSSLKEVPPDIMADYFDKIPGKQLYAVKPALKDGVRLTRHDILKDPPPAPRFELIFVRNNLLTYYRRPEKDRALGKIVGTLSPGGALITGAHEKLPDGFTGLRAAPEHPWIYFKFRRRP